MAFDPDKYLVEKTAPQAFDPDKYLGEKLGPQSPQMSMGKAALTGLQQGASLGLRPVVAGLGAVAGDLIGQYQVGKGVDLGQTKNAFLEARQTANQEQEQAAKDHPNISTAADIGGSLLSLPLMPARGFAGAVKLGAGLGAAQAAGSANSLGEAAADVAGGTLLGAGGHVVGKAVGYVADKAGGLAKRVIQKTASELSGVPDKEIEAYAVRADKINKMIGDANNSVDGQFNPQIAANHMRDNILNDVKRTKAVLNSHIDDALKHVPEISDPSVPYSGKAFSVDPIINEMESYKARLDPIYQTDQIKAVNDVIDTVRKKAEDGGGKLSLKGLQATKKFLYDVAEESYKPNSKFFQVGSDMANAAKAGGASAKEMIDTFGPPEIQNANRQLAQLHQISESMGSALLDTSKPASSLFATGYSPGSQNTEALRKLGQFTGNNYLQGVTDLSAARTFANPALFQPLKTGGALKGPVIGSALGSAVGGIVDGPEGALRGAQIGGGIGALVSSPAALKFALDSGRVTGNALAAVARAYGANPNDLNTISKILQQPQAQQILMQAMGSNNKVSTTIKTKKQLGK